MTRPATRTATLLPLLLLAACQSTTQSTLPPGGDALGAAGADVPMPPRVAIGAVQGTGPRSPLLGRQVTIEGVVTGNVGKGLGGVFVQEAAPGDGDPATSDALFVVRDASHDGDAGGEPALHAGDRVRVSGTVTELGNDELTTLTALRDATVSVLGDAAGANGGAIMPVAVTQAPAQAGDWERLEGMRVAIRTPLTVSDNGGVANYGELVASFDGRLFQPTELAAPGPEVARLAADNTRRKLVLDDGSAAKGPMDAALLGGPISDAAPLRDGSTLADVEGIVDQRRGAWRLQLTAPLQVAQAPRPPAPDVAGDTRIASLNLLNLFNGDGHGGGFPTERGAVTEAQYRVQQAKLVEVVQALRPDIAGLMEVENDGSGPDATAAQFVAALNARGPLRDYALIDTGPRLGGDAIHVAMIYRKARVTPVGKPATLTGGPFEHRSRVPMAQAFRAGRGPVFLVETNHFKSKGCGHDADAASGADADQHDGQGCWNPVRVDSAQRVVAWLDGDPTHAHPVRRLLIGDFNAHAMEDPLRTLHAAGWQDAFALAKVARPYSFVFDGQAGRLDHALPDAAMAKRLRGAVEWHNNADEPEALDYHFDTSIDPYRASDHDPILLGFDLR